MGRGGGLERTEEPDRHAGNDARLAARLDEADDAAAGGQRGEDVGGEFKALGEGEVSVRPLLSARGGLGVVLPLLLLFWCCWCCFDAVGVVGVATGSIAKKKRCARSRRFVGG